MSDFHLILNTFLLAAFLIKELSSTPESAMYFASCTMAACVYWGLTEMNNPNLHYRVHRVDSDYETDDSSEVEDESEDGTNESGDETTEDGSNGETEVDDENGTDDDMGSEGIRRAFGLGPSYADLVRSGMDGIVWSLKTDPTFRASLADGAKTVVSILDGTFGQTMDTVEADAPTMEDPEFASRFFPRADVEDMFSRYSDGMSSTMPSPAYRLFQHYNGDDADVVFAPRSF